MAARVNLILAMHNEALDFYAKKKFDHLSPSTGVHADKKGELPLEVI